MYETEVRLVQLVNSIVEFNVQKSHYSLKLLIFFQVFRANYMFKTEPVDRICDFDELMFSEKIKIFSAPNPFC